MSAKLKILIISLILLAGMSSSVYSVTIYIGDVDGFGYGAASSYKNEVGGVCDIDGGGILDSGDVLPDLNQNGTVATGSGDNFNYRSSAERYATDGSAYTDVALSNNYDIAIGSTTVTKNYKAHNVTFKFRFTVPEVGDIDYGQDHFINLLYADYDVNPMYAVVEGEQVTLLGNSEGGMDGYIWRAYYAVAWEDMTDGAVDIKIYAPDEPYVAFDYALLDTTPIPVPTDTIPEPLSCVLLGIGVTGLIRKLRK